MATLGKRKLDDQCEADGGSNKKSLQTSQKLPKRKIPKDPESGLPLCRKYMENKKCDRTKCRFAHVDRHLRAPCPDFSSWGLCSYGDESCFLVHRRSQTTPLSIHHSIPHLAEQDVMGEKLDTCSSQALQFPTQKNFKYPINFQNSDVKDSALEKYPFICIFSVASGFMSRFLSRFSELYPIGSDGRSKLILIEAFRGFTKSASNDTIGLVFAPNTYFSSSFDIMKPLATETFSSRHCRDEVLYLNCSSTTFNETAKSILEKWAEIMKSRSHNDGADQGIVRVKAFPPARKVTQMFAVQLLMALAEQQQQRKNNDNDEKDTEKVISFPILFPTVDRQELYRELREKNCLFSSSFLNSPSSDIGIQDATFELHISPYGGNWLWGLHSVSVSDRLTTISIEEKQEMMRTTVTAGESDDSEKLPRILCSTIRDTYFLKHNAIQDLRQILGIRDSRAMKNNKPDDNNESIPPICRAYWKLHEIMKRRPHYFTDLFSKGLSQTKTTYAIDIGAAPGGWTQFLCDLVPNSTPIKVFAIDPSELNKKIKQFSNVINIQKRSEDALEEIQSELSNNKNNDDEIDQDMKNDVAAFEGFDLLVCDANVSATQTLDLIRPVIPLLKTQSAQAVITAKNQFSGGKAGAEKVQDLFNEEITKAKSLYEKAGLQIVEVIHLFANSLNETTMMVKICENHNNNV